MIPGEYRLASEPVVANPGRPTVTVEVTNSGDRPIQVGSHYHFFEANGALLFDRASARGYRLDIPAGTAVRFEPGDAKTVQLVALAGVTGFLLISGMVIPGFSVNLSLSARDVDALRAKGAPTSRSTLGLEKRTYPFMRARDPALQAWLEMKGAAPEDVLGETRRRKEAF